ncbi:hypothetical protein GGH19_002893 [Coemansia sp. RSA 1807]|nr:hypothetical protein GGH20_003646 [Coemansia sp. RSA 1937]KAJ2575552.1 hypothetical protein GGH19_002893 [Coemansia sp. RSA 1807]
MNVEASHPYVPEWLDLAGYVAPEHGALELCAIMGTAVVLVLALACTVLRRRVRGTELAAALWFVLCGTMHCTFELYFVLHYRGLAARRDVVASMWKEYAKSDSRYMQGGTGNFAPVLAQEASTVFAVGPLCWLTVYAMWTRRSAVHELSQLAASVMHMQSVLLYFGAELLAREPSCRPEPQYFYMYFVGANLPWLVVPLVLATSSVTRMRAQMAIARAAEKTHTL